MAEISTVSLNLVKKKNTKSVVWNYFGIKADENGVQIPGEDTRPICRTCLHLRDGNPALYKEAMKTQAKPSVQATFQKAFLTAGNSTVI